MGSIDELLQARKKDLFFYSPYNFLRDYPIEKQIENCIIPEISSFESNPNNRIINIETDGNKHLFYISYLPWDSEYFGFTTYKLTYVLFTHHNLETLSAAVGLFVTELTKEQLHCFIEIPSEDTLLIKALCIHSFQLVETRLTYFIKDLKSYNHQRYPVRKAEKKDIPALKKVAMEMRNDFDRFHADNVYNTETADQFLGVYLEKSIEGLADVTLIPDDKNFPSDSFFTAKYMQKEWSKNEFCISKIVLVAVSSKTNRGWHKKLLSEMTYHLRDIGADFVYMNTQSTNRAVINNCENLGYRLGCITHILSFNNLK